MTTNKTIADMAQIIKEIKEFEEMKKSLMAEIEQLKDECIAWMADQGVDEILADTGKVTYREVISKRFDSTAFKKDFADIYAEYTKQTSNMRFTCN